MKDWPKWLWPVVIGGFVIALVLVALAREPVQLDPTTPAGTVQAYLQAISDGDYETALEALDPQSFEGCTAADIRRTVWQDSFTATLPNDVDDSGERVVVEVTMRFGGQGVFDRGWESRELFVLTQHDGAWLITEDPWPYFGWDCRDEGF